MALPVTISGVTVGNQNSYHGPFKSIGGNFYVLVNDTEAEAWKATDPTDSFTEFDNANHPAFNIGISSWTFQKEDILYLVAQDGVKDVWHAQFDMGPSADTWVNIAASDTDILVVDLANVAGATAVSIAVGSGEVNDEIVIAYQGEQGDNKDMGGSFEWIAYAISDDAGVGASWSTGNSVADTDNDSEVDFIGPVIVRGTSDRMHIFFNDATNNDGYQRTLTAAGSLETFPSAFETSINTSNYVFTNGVLLENRVYTLYHDNSAKHNEVTFISADVPIPTITQDITVNNSAFVSLALDGSDLHLVYRGTAGDLFHAEDTGSGWGNESEIVDNATINFTSINIYDRDGPKLAYIYDDAGTVLYGELALTHTFGLLSDVNMGKQNSFHGPFET